MTREEFFEEIDILERVIFAGEGFSIVLQPGNEPPPGWRKFKSTRKFRYQLFRNQLMSVEIRSHRVFLRQRNEENVFELHEFGKIINGVYTRGVKSMFPMGSDEQRLFTGLLSMLESMRSGKPVELKLLEICDVEVDRGPRSTSTI